MADQDEQILKSSEETTMARPQRWAQPFDPDMSDEDIDSLIKNALFKDVDTTKFPKHIPFDAHCEYGACNNGRKGARREQRERAHFGGLTA